MENLISDDLDSMKNLCLDLREHATKLINYEKKRNDTINDTINDTMIPLKKIHREQNVCYICQKRFSNDDDDKKYYRARDHCHYRRK